MSSSAILWFLLLTLAASQGPTTLDIGIAHDGAIALQQEAGFAYSMAIIKPAGAELVSSSGFRIPCQSSCDMDMGVYQAVSQASWLKPASGFYVGVGYAPWNQAKVLLGYLTPPADRVMLFFVLQIPIPKPATHVSQTE